MEAAVRIEPGAGSLREKVLRAFVEQGDAGFTDEDGIWVTGIPASTYRPRRIELVTMGWLRDSGRTRATRSGRKASVWVLVG